MVCGERWIDGEDNRPEWAKYNPPAEVRFTSAGNRRYLNLTKLAAVDRARWQAFWSAIKREEPSLARLLQDPMLHELRERFNGSICIAGKYQTLLSAD